MSGPGGTGGHAALSGGGGTVGEGFGGSEQIFPETCSLSTQMGTLCLGLAGDVGEDHYAQETGGHPVEPSASHTPTVSSEETTSSTSLNKNGASCFSRHPSGPIL